MSTTNYFMKHIVILCLGLISLFTAAQDIHFSQMQYSPLNLNPALAGVNHGLQAIANYRTQWSSVANPFQTFGASFDMRAKEKPGKKGFLAGGINFFHDVAGTAKVATTNFNLNVAYHIYAGENSTIGLGMQTGLGQRSIGNTAGTWGNQFDGIQFNPLIPNGEFVDRPAFIHFDAGAGIVYNFKRKERYMSGNDEFSFTAGISAFHLNRPNYSFIQTANERLSIRYAAFAMARIGKMNSNYAFTPALYYNRQGGHQEILAGTYLRVKVSESSHYTGYIDEMAVSFGAFYRVQDALVAKFLFEFAGYSFGFSYDINLSKLTRASNGRGGMEFFLRYTLGNIFQPNSQMRFK